MPEGCERVEITPPEMLQQFDSVPQNDFYAYRGEGHYKMVLAPLVESDYPIVDECVEMIRAAVAKYC